MIATQNDLQYFDMPEASFLPLVKKDPDAKIVSNIMPQDPFLPLS